MYEIPLLRFFEKMVRRVILSKDKEVFGRLPIPGYYNPVTYTLVLADDLDTELHFRVAYAALLKHIHPYETFAQCVEWTDETADRLPQLEKRWIVEFLKTKTVRLRSEK